MMRHITLAGRGSKLALAQNEIVKGILENAGYEVSSIVVSTKGDRDKKTSVTALGGNGPFVRDIEKALLAGKADIAVHCVKDLPYDGAAGLVIAGIIDEADARDVLLLRHDAALRLGSGTDAERDTGKVFIGTGSPRRKVQLERLYPNVECLDIRGNITTRIEKLRAKQYDGIVLAKAGIDRIGADLGEFDVITLSADEVIPAVGQGLLAVQCREEDAELRQLLFELSPAKAYVRYQIEREIFCRFRMNCKDAVAVYAEIDERALTTKLRLLTEECRKEQMSATGDQLPDTCPEPRKPGRVYIVGAGPSAGLMTEEGLAAVRKADVIIFDELLDEKILLEAGRDALLIPAGKRWHNHSKTQEEINEILVQCAREYDTVVRLKGGDPFVFGRGGEEFLALEAAGIDAKVIPGVSSAVAAAEVMGIPVTHRGSASSFTVVTGHGAAETAEDFETLARLKGTLVFMMAWRKIEEIAAGLMKAGKSADTPAAIVCNAYMPGQKRVTDRLGSIADRIDETYSPCVFIVGDVAQFEFASKERGRLFGKSYLVTGTREFAQKMCSLLTLEGASAMPYCCLEVRKIPGRIPKDFSDTGWLVFTSMNGVRIFFDELSERHTDIRTLSHIRFACIGEATAAELAKHQISADLVPETYASGKLGEALAARYSGGDGRVMMLRAAEASDELGNVLAAHGIPFEEIAVYCLRRPENLPAIKDFRYDGVILASAGGAKAFYELAGKSGDWEKVRDVPAVCIGSYTAASWEKLTGGSTLVADVSTARGIIEALYTYNS